MTTPPVTAPPTGPQRQGAGSGRAGTGGVAAGGPPPGWYEDPGGSSAWRWWDGSAWTAHIAPARQDGSAPAPPWMQLHGPAVDREARLVPWATASVVGAVAVALLYGLLPIAYSSTLAALYHWFRLALDAAAAVPRRTPPPYPAVAVSYVRLIYAGDLLYAGAGVVFLVWQHRAADAARRLGLPAQHRPGWGVALWFIPIVNLWCPYQALRDCLPSGHPRRRTAAWCWMAYLAAACAAAAVFVTAPYHRPIAIAAVAAEGLLLATVGCNGARCIRAVASVHRELAGR